MHLLDEVVVGERSRSSSSSAIVFFPANCSWRATPRRPRVSVFELREGPAAQTLDWAALSPCAAARPNTIIGHPCSNLWPAFPSPACGEGGRRSRPGEGRRGLGRRRYPPSAAPSHRHGRLDRRPGVVTLEENRFRVQIEERAYVAEHELRQGRRRGRVVRAPVLVDSGRGGRRRRCGRTRRLEPAVARDQMGEQSVARDVERDAKKDVGRALVELARQLSR